MSIINYLFYDGDISMKKPIKSTKCGKIVFVEKLLGRERAVGLAYQGEGLIEIDPRQTSKEYMDTVIHESLHMFFPDWTERKVKVSSRKLSSILWKYGYRRVDL